MRRILTDNGTLYRSRAWRNSLSTDQIARKGTRPYRLQTNGQVERYHHTLLN